MMATKKAKQKFHIIEAVAQRCTIEKFSFKNFQSSQESTTAGVSFIINLTEST